jgi:peptidyl-prolyl cis-trans isomerase A (cyclophilin A)
MRCLLASLALTFLAATVHAESAPFAKAASIHVVLETSRGEIELVIDTVHAPGAAANFLRYVGAGLYDGGVFHRTVRPDNQPGQTILIEVIQGGIDPTRSKLDGPPIALERTRDTSLKHSVGAISMARDGPDTATSDFFICIGAQPELDFGGKRNPDGQGFAAFGHVVRGLDVVRAIQRSPADGQALKPTVKIIRGRRL